MKRFVLFGLVWMLVLLMLSACATSDCPREGVWYCEKLDIYLDMESSNKGMYLAQSGNYEPLKFHVDQGTGLYIEFRESEREIMTSDTERICTDFRYRDHVLILTDRESNEEYRFVEADRERYPGG